MLIEHTRYIVEYSTLLIKMVPKYDRMLLHLILKFEIHSKGICAKVFS